MKAAAGSPAPAGMHHVPLDMEAIRVLPGSGTTATSLLVPTLFGKGNWSN